MKYICIFLYYTFAKYLPASNSRLTRWCKYVRRYICSPIFDKCGKGINIEHGASFGMGGGISIGSHSALGINSNIQSPVTIGDYVLMGP